MSTDMNTIYELARPEMRDLEAYQESSVHPSLERLHANEVPWRLPGDNSAGGLNHYPEPQPGLLCDRLADLYAVSRDRLLVTRGSDDAIDLLVRAFCKAGRDAICVSPPTFDMYAHAARVQGAGVVESPLQTDEFSLDVERLDNNCGPAVKLVFLCSPNNPTGNLFARERVLGLCEELRGRALVVVDEAYVEFAGEDASLVSEIEEHENLVVLRTLSKAFALAGARCGVLTGHPDLIRLLVRLMPPYSLPSTTVEAVMQLFDPEILKVVDQRIIELRAERERLRRELQDLAIVQRVWPSQANFLLVESREPQRMLEAGRDAGVLLRDLSARPHLRNCVRITVGNPAQNAKLQDALRGV